MDHVEYVANSSALSYDDVHVALEHSVRTQEPRDRAAVDVAAVPKVYDHAAAFRVPLAQSSIKAQRRGEVDYAAYPDDVRGSIDATIDLERNRKVPLGVASLARRSQSVADIPRFGSELNCNWECEN